MEKVFDKLVRDNIPSIIENNGEVAITEILKDEDYINELYKKLLAEANEVIDSKKPIDTLEELADVFEVLKAIAEFNGKSIDDIIEIADEKRAKRGGFGKRVFLKKTYKK